MFYQVGENAILGADITNSDNVAVNPATVKITINNPKGSKVISAVEMTTDETGVYYYSYLCPAVLGEYNYKVVAVGGGGRITIVKDSFHVNESIG